ncbi:hypothetical protein [Nostoc sp. C052]|nr:hypothetical protein [Nostoc sp. C052]
MRKKSIQNDALYETLRERRLALSFAVASRREAMPKALRCANKIQN